MKETTVFSVSNFSGAFVGQSFDLLLVQVCFYGHKKIVGDNDNNNDKRSNQTFL